MRGPYAPRVRLAMAERLAGAPALYYGSIGPSPTSGRRFGERRDCCARARSCRQMRTRPDYASMQTTKRWNPVRRGAAICLAAVNTYSLLTIVFAGLRMAGVLNWPWVWVLSPIWLPLAAIGAATIVWLLWEYVVD